MRGNGNGKGREKSSTPLLLIQLLCSEMGGRRKGGK